MPSLGRRDPRVEEKMANALPLFGQALFGVILVASGLDKLGDPAVVMDYVRVALPYRIRTRRAAP